MLLACLLLASTSLALAGVQGLALLLEAGGRQDARRERLAALHVPAGQPVSPFLAPGSFKARWEGSLVSEVRQEVRFRVVGGASAKLTISGKPVPNLAEGGDATLDKGENTLVLEAAGDGKADLTLRLEWAGRGFGWEPVPPEAFRHDPAKVVAGMQLREGRRLFAELRCATCHVGPDKVPPPGQGMPELAKDAPVLANYGERFREPYLAHWIQDPHAFRPGSLMPRVFAPTKDGSPDPRAADLAAFLVSQGSPPATSSVDPAKAGEGAALFASLGCLACHATPDVPVAKAGDRTPLAHVAAKWHGDALVEYLLDPARHYRTTKMPNFRLSRDEAGKLAAYLLASAKAEVAPAPKGDAARGAALLVSEGCINCHAGAAVGNRPSLADTLAKGWRGGCVAEDAAGRGRAPDFVLSASQREALRAFAKTDFASLRQDSPAEFAQRQVAELRCGACHDHDGAVARRALLKDEAKLLLARGPAHKEGEPLPDGPVPALTWLGEKLKADWSAKFIAGEPMDKPRPWLAARMPGYAFHGAGLAAGLSFQHGFPLACAPEPPLDADAASVGERLAGAAAGFNCIQCHAAGSRPATAAFEAPGNNLASSTARLRRTYYDRWMLAPNRIDPSTKMPRFADEDGLTALTDVEDGDAAAQFGAIWEHLRALGDGAK